MSALKVVLFATALASAGLYAQQLSDLSLPAPIPSGSTLVIGFLGGFERWNDPDRSVRRLALKLRETPGVYAESISNHHRQVALDLICRVLDANRNGLLDSGERRKARIILYGQSWGGAAAIATAADLEGLGVPVLLTVQVDSVGWHDRLVPPNVLSAVNFYQRDLLTIQGRREIVAADPARTHIIGNFAASYPLGPAAERNASWARRTFGGSHAKMELDSIIWDRVERYIRDAIARK